MQFLYHKEAGEQKLIITGEEHKYLFKVRRFEVGKTLSLRNLEDNTRYVYEIQDISKKEAVLIMIERYHDSVLFNEGLHILWCIIDTKVIEKTLPMLNQLGVKKITFLYCDRSQKNFKIDVERIKKILINSCQQSGRSNLMEIELLDSLEMTLQKYENFSLLDFGGKTDVFEVKAIMIGCEGGFSENEREKLKNKEKIGLKTDFILKSETAALVFASKGLI